MGKVTCVLFMTISIMHGETGEMFKGFFLLKNAEVVNFCTKPQYCLGFFFVVFLWNYIGTLSQNAACYI